MEKAPKENRFEYVVIASARAKQLFKGAQPREAGDKKISIAQREVMSGKVAKEE
jgi:DNA-directed RNA polymerase omega subunit